MATHEVAPAPTALAVGAGSPPTELFWPPHRPLARPRPRARTPAAALTAAWAPVHRRQNSGGEGSSNHDLARWCG